MRFFRALAYGALGLRPWEFRRLTLREFARMTRGYADYQALTQGKNPFERKDDETDRRHLAEVAKERGLI